MKVGSFNIIEHPPSKDKRVERERSGKRPVLLGEALAAPLLRWDQPGAAHENRAAT
jgi:hypothetical protein